jgi:hypothetical protein
VIDIELEESDWVAKIRPTLRDRKANGYLWAIPPSKKRLRRSSWYSIPGLAHMFESDELYAMWKDLLQIADPKAFDEQLRKIGNYKFEQFETIPLFDVFIEVVVDPKFIEDWPFSGWDGGDIGHTWLIKACKQDKCK